MPQPISPRIAKDPTARAGIRLRNQWKKAGRPGSFRSWARDQHMRENALATRWLTNKGIPLPKKGANNGS